MRSRLLGLGRAFAPVRQTVLVIAAVYIDPETLGSGIRIKHPDRVAVTTGYRAGDYARETTVIRAAQDGAPSGHTTCRIGTDTAGHIQVTRNRNLKTPKRSGHPRDKPFLRRVGVASGQIGLFCFPVQAHSVRSIASSDTSSPRQPPDQSTTRSARTSMPGSSGWLRSRSISVISRA